MLGRGSLLLTPLRIVQLCSLMFVRSTRPATDQWSRSRRLKTFAIHSHFSGPCEIASMPKTRKMSNFCGQKTRFSTNCVELSTDIRRSNSWPTYLHYGYLVVLNGMLACLLVAISGLFGTVSRTSALPPKADINGYGAGCPLLTHLGHRVR